MLCLLSGILPVIFGIPPPPPSSTPPPFPPPPRPAPLTLMIPSCILCLCVFVLLFFYVYVSLLGCTCPNASTSEKKKKKKRKAEATLKCCYVLHCYMSTIFSHNKHLAFMTASNLQKWRSVNPPKMACGCPCGRVVKKNT